MSSSPITAMAEVGYLLDVNVLMALARPAHTHHRLAHDWFRSVTRWFTTPVTETAFVRLTMNPAVSGRAVTATEALALLAAWRQAPGHHFLPDDSSLAEAVIDPVTLTGHHQVTDFHLVNLAARHRLQLATLDNALLGGLAPKDRRHVKLIGRSEAAPA